MSVMYMQEIAPIALIEHILAISHILERQDARRIREEARRAQCEKDNANVSFTTVGKGWAAMQVLQCSVCLTSN